MSSPIRILHVLGKLNMGGAESRIMDLYRHIDRTKVQFDFLVHAADPVNRPKEDFDDEVRSLGGRIYVLPRFTGLNLGEYRCAAKAFFREHHDFAAVEGHMTSMAGIYLPIARAAGVPVTLAHARSAGTDRGIRGLATRFFRRDLAQQCDLCLSCSRAASVAVFGQKAVDAGLVHIVPNALDIRSLSFDPVKRRQIRAELGIADDTFVIGHVGRFDPVKNQSFLAEVLHRMTAVETSGRRVLCLFLGKGTLQPAVEQAFHEAGLAGAAVFAGQCNRERTIAMYQAFDAFCLPSLYEGLPGTVIEAQAAGLPTLISDTITDEVCITDLVQRLPITDAAVWAAEMEKRRQEMGAPEGYGKPENGSGPADAAGSQPAGRMENSEKAIRALGDAGYDIVTEAQQMQRFYLGGCQVEDLPVLRNR